MTDSGKAIFQAPLNEILRIIRLTTFVVVGFGNSRLDSYDGQGGEKCWRQKLIIVY